MSCIHRFFIAEHLKWKPILLVGLIIGLVLLSGARAAQAWIDAVTANPTSTAWAAALEDLDMDPAKRGPGQTTAIAIEVRADGLAGVCVGDSAVWLVTA